MNRGVTYIVAFVAILCCLMADSCSQKEEFYPELSISCNGVELAGSSLSFDDAGGSQTIKIKCNADWRVDCNSDWVEISPKSGNGTANATIAVAPSESSRSAVVTISMPAVEQMRHSFNVIQYVVDKPTPDEPTDEPENPTDNPTDNPENPEDTPEDEPTDEPSEEPTEPETPETPETPEEPENPAEPENPDTPTEPEPETPIEPSEPEQPEEQTPLAITIPELIALMKSDGTPSVIDAERDRVLSAVVMNNPTGTNYPTSHLIVATEGSTAPHNGVVLYGRIVKPEALGAKCGDRVEVVLKAGLAVAIKNNSIMYEVTGDASKQWAEVSIMARNAGISIADVTPAELESYQGMTVRLKSATPLSEGAWNEPGANGEVEFEAANGEKFTVQVLESATFASHQYHIAQGDICGVVAIDGKKVVLRPRTVEDIAPFDGPAPEESSEPEDEEPSEPEEEPSESENESETPDNPSEGGDNNNGNEGNNPEGDKEDDKEGDKDKDNEVEQPEDKPTEPEPETPTEPEEPEQPAEPEKPTEPTEPEQPTTPTSPAEKYSEIKLLSELNAGSYYIGGYRDGQLYLATGEMTAQWHGTTAAYTYQQGEFSANDESNATPIEVVLELADNGKGYYIHFADKGYLVAIAAKAGALRFSDKPDNYWIFSQHAEQGFEVRQSGDIDVQLIISQTASDALLRSVAGDAEGLGIVLFRHNQ